MDDSLKVILEKFLDHKTVSRDELELLRALLETEEGRDVLYEQMDLDLEELERQPLTAEHSAAAERVLARVRRVIRLRSLRSRWFRAAAVVVPIVALGAALLWVSDRAGLLTPTEYRELVAERGECVQMVFQDGTHVWLNGGSTLTYPATFGLGSRSVELQGEGFFSVTPGSREFKVSTAYGTVRVHGTEFNVEAYAEAGYTRVSLQSGAVDFETAADRYTLTPGQQLTFRNASGDIAIDRPSDISRSSAWKDNILYLNQLPLQDVLFELSHWYDADFEIADSAATACTFTYSGERLPLRDLLDDLELISPLKFEPEGAKVKIYLKN